MSCSEETSGTKQRASREASLNIKRDQYKEYGWDMAKLRGKIESAERKLIEPNESFGGNRREKLSRH